MSITDNIDEFGQLERLINKFTDDAFWKPFGSDQASIDEFDRLVLRIEESQTWPKNMNKQKGELLEDFAVFLFSRFQDVSISRNQLIGDNEIDIEVSLSDKVRPAFVNDYIGPKIICECKNYKNTSIDVGMVSKLAEILPTRGAKFGVFISINGIGGYGWKYGVGKQKKILLKENLPIISLRFEELKLIRQGKNLYTMLKQKIRALYDEVEDDSPDFPANNHSEFPKRIFEIVGNLEKCGLVEREERKRINDRIIKLYGDI